MNFLFKLFKKRNGHSIIIYNDYLVLFGGIKELTHERNDVWIYKTKEKAWKVQEELSSTRKVKKMVTMRKATMSTQGKVSTSNDNKKDKDNPFPVSPTLKLKPKQQKKAHMSSKAQYKILMN